MSETYEIKFKITGGATTDVKSLRSEVEKLTKTSKKQENAFKGGAENQRRSAGKLSAGIGGIAKSLIGIGAGLVTVHKISSVFADATKRFAEFERQTILTGAVTNATEADMKALVGTALQLGGSLQFTATQVASLQQVLGQAGLTTNEILQSQEVILKASIATGTDLNRVGSLLTATMRGMGISFVYAEDVMDKMTATATSSSVTMESLRESMNYAAPTAKALGIELNEVLAYIAKMGDSGLRGSLATRAFATALTRLARPTGEMKKVMKELNLNFFDSENKMKSLIGIVEELERSLHGLSDKERARAVSTIFGAESFQEISILLNTGSKHLQRYADGLDVVTGRTKEMADALGGTAFDATKRLESAWDALLLTIGDSEVWKAIKKGTTDELVGINNALAGNRDLLTKEDWAYLKTMHKRTYSTLSLGDALQGHYNYGSIPKEAINELVAQRTAEKERRDLISTADKTAREGDALLTKALGGEAGTARAAYLRMRELAKEPSIVGMNEPIEELNKEVRRLSQILNISSEITSKQGSLPALKEDVEAKQQRLSSAVSSGFVGNQEVGLFTATKLLNDRKKEVVELEKRLKILRSGELVHQQKALLTDEEVAETPQKNEARVRSVASRNITVNMKFDKAVENVNISSIDDEGSTDEMTEKVAEKLSVIMSEAGLKSAVELHNSGGG